MIPADIGAEIARLLRAGVATGEWPATAAELSAAGTWRPAPSGAGDAARSYATSLPLSLASLAGRSPTSVAEALAPGLTAMPWIDSARVTGDGYLTVTVTYDHLANLAARIVAKEGAAANSDALAGRKLTTPVQPDLSAASTWELAWQAQRDVLTGRLARAAGAQLVFDDPEQDLAHPSARQAGPGSVPVTGAQRSLVADAIAFYGAGAVSYALARTPAPKTDSITRQLRLPLDLDNPFVLVRYAHADAASTLRWASDLELSARQEPCRAAAAARELVQPELALLNAMSWLPERVAAAARRRRPAELAAHLEYLAQRWLDCRECCPVMPFHGSAAPGRDDGERTAARLCLADAARAAISSGLGLLGIGAQERV